MEKKINIKVLHSHTEYLVDALGRYFDLTTLYMASNPPRKDDYEIRFSIAIQLHDRIKSLFCSHIRADNHLIALELHEAIVIQFALSFYIDSQCNDSRRNAMIELKNDLHKQRDNTYTTVTT